MENKKPRYESIEKLFEAIEAKGLKVSFGLERQGHIPYIEETLKKSGWNYHTWIGIGNVIGWEPLTACCYYYNYIHPTPAA